MKTNRREFLVTTLGAALGATLQAAPVRAQTRTIALEELDAAAKKPVLRAELFKDPIIIAAIDLLKNGEEWFVRVRSKDGAVGMAVSNNERMDAFYPILTKIVAPYFIGKDARQLETLIDGVYVHDSNYKLQGLAFWMCVASVEFAILDLLGHLAGKPVGDLLGSVTRNEIKVYRANNDRGLSAEESVRRTKKRVEEIGAKALKFKVGGRLGFTDSPPGRTEKLIPLMRKTFGDEMVIMADANGSYNVAEAVRVGRMLEEHKITFYEEPCAFDELEETKQVADTLTIPIAGGEQESSLWRFRWMIHNHAVQIVQPDLFYFGGFIRSVRVARMAAAAGLECTPHMSGSSVGYLYVIHFASFVPNAGEFMEYKGKSEKMPIHCDTSTLICKDGIVRVPTCPGFGITIDPDFVNQAAVITG
ncbi:MAG: mandelate racemase/muconate lactonizing enzyme family protein [candidate division KSB1 bacterium]|nr:mandelate racemase/muconate lactonizing enzyme family protein [candidate division KSB1 bacterium]